LGPAMPSFSTSSSSSSVFGRFGGRRQPNELAIGDRLSRPLEVPAEGDKSKLINGHKRESSIYSLTSSVSDLGQNVKRSVSLRSHRTQPSTGSVTFGHKPRFPSSGNLITSSFPTSPAEEEEPKELPPPSSYAPPTPRRGKLSISARSLSSKFRSTDNLPTLAHPDLPEPTADRPTTAVSVHPPLTATSMLAPALPKRAPPDRPSLQPQASFTRDLPSSHGSNLTLQPTSTIPTNPQNPLTIYQTIHETAAKRIATIAYLRAVHAGGIFYFGTWHYTPSSLSSIPSMHPLKLGRRANSYLVLGYSLPVLLDLNSSSPLEYLKALSALLSEFETYQSLSGFDATGNSISKGRMNTLFKSATGLGARSRNGGRRASTVTDSLPLTTPSSDYLGLPRSATEATSPLETPSPTPASGHEFTHLVTPHLPFDADFATTYATLCDVLVDTYGKLMDLVPSPEVCGPGVGVEFGKADKAIRKILVANVLRQFEEGTRASVKGEVAGLGKLVLGGLM